MGNENGARRHDSILALYGNPRCNGRVDSGAFSVFCIGGVVGFARAYIPDRVDKLKRKGKGGERDLKTAIHLLGVWSSRSAKQYRRYQPSENLSTREHEDSEGQKWYRGIRLSGGSCQIYLCQ